MALPNHGIDAFLNQFDGSLARTTAAENFSRTTSSSANFSVPSTLTPMMATHDDRSALYHGSNPLTQPVMRSLADPQSRVGFPIVSIAQPNASKSVDLPDLAAQHVAASKQFNLSINHAAHWNPVIHVTPSSSAEPPAMPDYFERATSFISALLPTLILARIAAAFSKHGRVVFQTMARELKITGEATHNCDAFQFELYVYRGPEAGKYLVECQQQYGDRFGFNQFFHDMLDELDSAVLTRYSKRLPRPISPSINFNFLPAAVIQLCSMATAAERDVMREGIKGLVSLSCECDSAHLSEDSASAVIRVIVVCSSSDDWDVCRYVATLASNIASCTSARNALAAPEPIHALKQLFDSNQVSHAVETKRQVATALLRLSETHARSMLALPSFCELLENSGIADSSCTDSVVQGTMEAVRQRVAVALAAH